MVPRVRAEADTTGEWAVWHDFNTLNEEALHRAELLSSLPTIILLFVAFGSAIAAGLPLILAGLAEHQAVFRRVTHNPFVVAAGIAVHPNTKTVWNSQNTAIVRELIPAWGMVSHVSRMDDIYAAVCCHRVMREHGYQVHFGRPFAGQQRNQHNLVRDLRGEIDGYETVQRLADLLDHTPLVGKSVIEDTRRIWETLNHAAFIPGRSVSTIAAEW